jgi:N utilization substance protein B
MRFVNNRFISDLRNNADFAEHYADKPFSWAIAAETFLNNMLNTIIETEEYRNYMSAPTNDAEQDWELWRTLFKNVIAPSDELTEAVESLSLYWNEELNTEATFVLKTIKRFEPEKGADQDLLPEYRDDADKEFARKLFRNAINNAEAYRSLMEQNTKNWDMERLAFMDILIMQVALAEILSFPSIPTSVSLNEYVEVAKMYSTPKSGSFINGMLDTIVNQLKKENKLNKA